MVENKGYWIKLYQSFKEWHWYYDEAVKSLYIHCLLKAYVRDTTIGKQVIPKGSFVTSSLKLAEELGTTRQRIRTSLNKLISTNDLTIISTNKKSVISVVNYTIYQDKEMKSTNSSTNKLTSNQPATNQQLTTNKELKTLKKERIKDLTTYEGVFEKHEKGEMIPYKEIVEYLNQKTGLNLRHTTNKTRDLIKARWNEGFRFDEFKKCIDNAVKFRTKPNGEIDTRYLMPKTLFNGSFETRVLGTTYKTKPKDLKQEDDADSLKGRYDHLITRD